MRNAISVFEKTVLLVCIACSLILVGVNRPAAAAEPIKIGVVVSLTGWAGFIGTPQKEIITAVVDSTNKKGGINGRQVEILWEDDQSVPTNAIVSATKLIRDRKVCTVVGASTSDCSSAMIAITEQEKVPFFITAPVVDPKKRYSFVAGPGGARQATHLLEWVVKTFGAKRIALLHEDDAYGVTASEAILKEIKNYPGASIVIRERCQAGDTNMIPQLTKIKSAKADMMILYATANTAAVAAKNYKQLGMTTPVLGSNAITIPDFLKMAGIAAEENRWIFFSQPFMIAEKMNPNDPFRKNLYDPFKENAAGDVGSSKQPNLFHTSTYDCIAAAVAAIKLAGSDDRDAIRDATERSTYQGSSVLSLLPRKPLRIAQRRNGPDGYQGWRIRAV